MVPVIIRRVGRQWQGLFSVKAPWGIPVVVNRKAPEAPFFVGVWAAFSTVALRWASQGIQRGL
jgi:hypothetical protein